MITDVLDAQSYICGLTIACAKILRIYGQFAHFDLTCTHHTHHRNVFKKGTLWCVQLTMVSEQAKQRDD